MKKMRLTGILIAFCLMLAVGSNTVFAQSFHDKADADKDRAVTMDEMKRALAERYKEEDANKDGKLTADEYLQARQKNFDDADKNRDGVVVVEEWVIYWCGEAGDAAKVKKPARMSRGGSRMQLMDTSGDKKVQKEECVAFWSGRFVDLDGNQDGKLTRDEYIRRMKDMAKTMDPNGDGVITVKEYYFSWVGKGQKNKKK